MSNGLPLRLVQAVEDSGRHAWRDYSRSAAASEGDLQASP
jgi:hypothetical protein